MYNKKMFYLELICLNLIIICLLLHWQSEIYLQRIFDSTNIVLGVIGLILLFTINYDNFWWHIAGALLPFAIILFIENFGPYIHIGGGVVKLVSAMGLILGFKQIVFTIIISSILYILFKFIVKIKFKEKEIVKIYKKYPSGFAVLSVLPVQLFLLV